MTIKILTTEQLIRLAKDAPVLKKKKGERRTTDKWIDFTDIMNRKGYSYDKIWKILKDQGEDVHPNPRSFASSMCQRLAKRRAKEALK